MTEENLTNQAYEAIELAAKTGKIKKGTNEVTKAIERGIAKLVLYAQDVNPAEVIMHLEPLCAEKETPCVKVPSREELGAAAGLNIPTSSVAVVQAGEADSIIKEIAKAQKKSAPKEEVKEAPKVEKEKKPTPKKEEAKPKEEAKKAPEEKKE